MTNIVLARGSSAAPEKRSVFRSGDLRSLYILSYVAIYLFHESLYDNSNIYSRTLLISNSYGANIKKAACLLGKTVQLFIVRKGYTMPSSNLKRFIFSDACSTKEHLILLVVAVTQSLVFASYFQSHLICQVNLTYLLT